LEVFVTAAVHLSTYGSAAVQPAAALQCHYLYGDALRRLPSVCICFCSPFSSYMLCVRVFVGAVCVLCVCTLCALDMSACVCLCALGCVLVFALRRRRPCIWWQSSFCSKFPPAEGMLLGILHKWLQLQRSGIAPVKWHSSGREAEATAWMLNWPPCAGKAACLRACKYRSCLQATAE
jgi:hypothetical protein